MTNSELCSALQIIEPEKIIRITLSCKKSELCSYKKVIVRKSADGFFSERFTEKQVFHEKIHTESIIDFIVLELTENFRQLNASCIGYDAEIKISKKGKILKNKTKNDLIGITSEEIRHNREKNYIIKDGMFVPALFELGIISQSGKVISSRYDKFKQINRFIECIDDALGDEVSENLEIIDFGCGKSYLTFVLYYYLTEIKKYKANITGLDLKKDVIEKCSSVADKYGYSGLHFICGDIKDFKPQKNPDMVITLHACDTATDFALYNAIRWNSKYIFSVPCCQHELNSCIKLENLKLMTEYGLIKERFSALATDALRAKLLESKGYKVDILEFIDMDNSPKNILIRAERKTSANSYKQKNIDIEIENFVKDIGTRPTLYNLLSKNTENEKHINKSE